MPFEPVTLGTFAGFTKILDYLRPTRSPYLVAIATTFICFLLLKSRLDGINEAKSFYFLIPSILFYIIFSTAPILLYILAPGGPIQDDEKVDLLEQFKFSRSVFVSIILISLYTLITSFGDINWIFYLSYILFIANLIVFSGYLLTREIREDSNANRNLIQIALINAIMILLVSQYAPEVNISDGELWHDCSVMAKVDHDQRGEDGNVSVDENGAPIRTQTEISAASCFFSEEPLQEQIKVENLSNPIVTYPINFEQKFSFKFLVFLTSWILSVVYFLFWIIRIGSVVRLKIIN